MSRRSPRTSTSIDLGRLIAGVRGPGLDTRVWLSLAYADGDSATEEGGQFVEVVLLPTGERLTARVASEYTGNGYGSSAKVYDKDELLVAVPRGNPAEGAVVVRRLWNARHKTPAQARANEAEDVTTIIRKDKHFRLETSGSGKSYFKSGDTSIVEAPKVRLGGEDATEQLVLGNTYKGAEQQFLTQVQTAAGTMNAAGALMSSAGAIMMLPIVGAIIAGPMIASAGASFITAATTLTAAATAFSTPFDTYLSQVSNTK